MVDKSSTETISKKDKKFLSTKDYIVSNETYNLYLDLKTKIVWTEINKQQNLNKYYKNTNYLPHNKKDWFIVHLI